MTGPDSDAELRQTLLRTLQSWRAAGVQQLPAARRSAPVSHGQPASARAPAPLPAGSPSARAATSPAAGKPAAGAPPSADRQSQLQVLAQEVSQCTQCPELVASRSRTVFGVGDPNAELCFFGEAPGYDEDRLGEPFVGKAGQLLDRILAACQLERKNVYILNVLKCRPPGNRDPAPQEIVNCRGYFEAQLRIIQPKFICCLGAFAARTLLNTEESVGRLRGRFHSYQDAQVVVTYHPAYLLRNPEYKRQTWEDMKMLLAAMA